MKTALVCIAKNEDNYLLEWINYNKKIGFDDIFIYQNNWTSSFNKLNIATFIQFDGYRQQLNAYNDFISKNYMNYDFVAFFDVDEFIVLKKHKNINEFLSNYTKFPAIGLNWRIFGDSHQTKVENNDYSVLNRFIYCEKDLCSNCKIILNFTLAKDTIKFYYNPHCVTSYIIDPNQKFLLKGVGCNEKVNENGNIEIAELNHYRNKTFQEYYDRKFNKELPDNIGKYPEFYDEKLFKESFDKWNKNDIINTTAKDFYNN